MFDVRPYYCSAFFVSWSWPLDPYYMRVMYVACPLANFCCIRDGICCGGRPIATATTMGAT